MPVPSVLELVLCLQHVEVQPDRAGVHGSPPATRLAHARQGRPGVLQEAVSRLALHQEGEAALHLIFNCSLHLANSSMLSWVYTLVIWVYCPGNRKMAGNKCVLVIIMTQN